MAVILLNWVEYNVAFNTTEMKTNGSARAVKCGVLKNNFSKVKWPEESSSFSFKEMKPNSLS